MEIVATAMKEFAKNQNLEADISLEDKIIKSNTNIPMILVDENGNIGADSYLNLDPEKAKDPDLPSRTVGNHERAKQSY